jgi:hypothetical protein
LNQKKTVVVCLPHLKTFNGGGKENSVWKKFFYPPGGLEMA